MTLDEKKKIVYRLYDEMLNQKNLGVVDELVSQDFVSHEPTPMDFGTGPDSLKRRVGMYRKGFPDQRIEIGDQIAEGDMVTTRWTTHGTHTGDLPGIPATGTAVSLEGVTISKLSEGKIVEEWVFYDRNKWLINLGVVPEMEIVAVCSDEKWDVGYF
jgi:steroid delta-isomerase-like uncharacterized protein